MTRRPFRNSALVIALSLLTLIAAGCQYQSTELFPEQYHSVSVPIFENRTFYRGVERDLGEALVKELEQRTPYKVTAPGAADTILQGTITQIDQRMLSRSRPGRVPEEMEVTITVDFEWKELHTGDTIRAYRGFEAVGRYVPTAPVGQPFEIAQHQAAQQLARDIVSTLQAQW